MGLPLNQHRLFAMGVQTRNDLVGRTVLHNSPVLDVPAREVRILDIAQDPTVDAYPPHYIVYVKEEGGEPYKIQGQDTENIILQSR